eukprot:CAMPEP_0197017568 /NCGR_PEP_ID=MMETSP1380-20130617/79618_1 /TAXON_ID=5936 /ORGANISM="Euplotes crassus, Strain CT5" /LENGTH=178 /DNA_ID=CAMNT_0042444689 /DNA_START=733 /DNA_END=1266 /DNA_ORIENTATION=-
MQEDNQNQLYSFKRMQQQELERENNEYSLKQEYGDFLKNQIVERDLVKKQQNMDQQCRKEYNRANSLGSGGSRIGSLHAMSKDKWEQVVDKKRDQEELRDMLNHQNYYNSVNKTQEPDIKPYSEKYQTNSINNLSSLGGLEVEIGESIGLSRRQNTYIEPNTIINPMNDYNTYIRETI